MQEPYTQLPGNALSNLYVNGCQVSVLTNNTVSVNAGQVRDSTDSFDILLKQPILLNFLANGANGLDTGTIAPSTPYYVFDLYDQTQANPPACLASLSKDSPIMPASNGVTYSQFRCVGWVLTDSSSNLLPFVQTGNSNVQHYQWYSPIVVLNSGNATAYTDISLQTAIPSAIGFYGKVQLQADFIPAAVADTFSVKAQASINPTFNIFGISEGVKQSTVFDIVPSQSVSEIPTLSYKVLSDTDALAISVTGFDINL